MELLLYNIYSICFVIIVIFIIIIIEEMDSSGIMTRLQDGRPKSRGSIYVIGGRFYIFHSAQTGPKAGLLRD